MATKSMLYVLLSLIFILKHLHSSNNLVCKVWNNCFQSINGTTNLKGEIILCRRK